MRAHRPTFRPRCEALEDRTAPAVYPVWNTNDSGPGSFRQAILDSNLTVESKDTIEFHIGDEGGVKTITPASLLPEITDPVEINGYTQKGAKPNTAAVGSNADLTVVIDCNAVPASGFFTGRGLRIAAGDTTVKGLVFNRFAGGNAIHVYGRGGNRIQGCFFGTNEAGTATVPGQPTPVFFGDGTTGIHIDGHTVPATGNLANWIGADGVGSDDLAERNVISGVRVGVALRGPSAVAPSRPTFHTVVAGNLIGTDRTGTQALGDFFGVASVTGANGDVIKDNVISGNALGINLGAGGRPTGDGVFDTTVTGNKIGVAADGTSPLGNRWAGITITFDSRNNRVGGTGPGEGNVIAYNGYGLPDAEFPLATQGAGIASGSFDTIEGVSPGGMNNSFRGNSIHSNDGLGIDLGGGYPQGLDGPNNPDPGDADPGPNNLQNFPEITAAIFGPAVTTVSGSLRSTPNAAFTLDFYAGSAADESGYGEGEYYLGSYPVNTGPDGLATFNNVSLTMPPGTSIRGDVVRVITATATDSAGNTSEFSRAYALADVTVFGTAGNDVISVGGVTGSAVAVTINGVSVGTSAVPGRVIVYGSDGDDGVAVGATGAEGMTADGQNGSDTYTVTFGGLSRNNVATSGASLDVTDTGTTGTDALRGLFSDGDDRIVKTPSLIEWALRGGGGILERVRYSNLEVKSVNGRDGHDEIFDTGATTILGGSGDDTITVYASLAGENPVVDGQGGSDTVTVYLGGLQSPVTVTDSGPTGTDGLRVVGLPGGDVVSVTESLVSRQAETVGYDVTVEALAVLTGEGDDTILVTATAPPGVVADGGDGSDTYAVYGGRLQGAVSVGDSGTAGTDGVTVYGTPGTDVITQSGNQLTVNGWAAITLGPGVTSLAVDGGGGTGDTYTAAGAPTVIPTVTGVAAAIVSGTAGDDTIQVRQGGQSGQVTAWVNGVLVGTYSPSGRLVAHALAGNDDIQTDGNVTVPVWYYGGDGDDRIKGGAGDDVLLGQGGADLLVGSSGRDLLVGGAGADRLVGNADDDILLAGVLLFEADLGHLAAVMAEWARTDKTAGERVNSLTAGGGHNGGVVLDGRTVANDADADVLTGSAGYDWFLFDSGRDRVTDLHDEAFSDDLPFING